MSDSRSRSAPEARRPRDFRSAVGGLDRATYENLRRALALGRWPDGRPLEPRQREICMEAVLTWEADHLPPEARTGYIDRGACADAPGGEASVDRIRILGEE